MNALMGSNKNTVAFVIVGWNNKPLLQECFDSIQNQTYKNIKVIYVDNDSQDGSVAFVRETYPTVTILEPGQNTGFAKGNNLGIAEALKDPEVTYIGLLNTDARIREDWTEELVQLANQKPKGACFQSTTLDYYNHAIIDSTHIFVAHNGQGTQGNWRYFATDEKGPTKVFGVNAAACIISRRFIEAQPFGSELFDEAMFMYLEDVDLAARATVMGWDNYLAPGTYAYHMGSASSGKNPNFSLYMTFRNNSGMLFKNFPTRHLLRMLPGLIRGDIDTLRTLRRTKKKGSIKAVIKGRFIGTLRLPLFIGKRYTLWKRRAGDPDYVWLLMRSGD